jgi:hypothetical protein
MGRLPIQSPLSGGAESAYGPTPPVRFVWFQGQFRGKSGRSMHAKKVARLSKRIVVERVIGHLLRFDVRKLHHLAPLLGFVDDELGEVDS